MIMTNARVTPADSICRVSPKPHVYSRDTGLANSPSCIGQHCFIYYQPVKCLSPLNEGDRGLICQRDGFCRKCTPVPSFYGVDKPCGHLRHIRNIYHPSIRPLLAFCLLSFNMFYYLLGAILITT